MVARAGLLQHLRVRGKAGDGLDVQALADLLGQLGALVDHRDVVAGPGQIARDVEADRAGAAAVELQA
jgi:hypothetical protein